MAKGDIVLIPFPFTDLSSHKRRPAKCFLKQIEDENFNKKKKNEYY